MRTLVTGAGGFVGRAVVRRLARDGHVVTALLHRAPATAAFPAGVTTAVADLRDRERIRDLAVGGRFEAVAHLAALKNVRDSLDHPLPYFDVNVGGTVSLLQALEDARPAGADWVRLVFASSHAVYGATDDDRPVSEDSAPLPINAYGASKLAAEHAIAHQASTGSLGAVSLRCFNVSGAVDGHGDPDLTRVIPGALAVAAGQAPVFPLNGDGSAVREFVHVADVAEAFRLALQSTRQGEHVALNVGSGVGISVREVLTVVERVTGRTVAVRVLPPKPEPRVVVADVTRVRQSLGWTPTRSAIDTIVGDAWAGQAAGSKVTRSS
jgi:UDP-glucose 4-epimerase